MMNIVTKLKRDLGGMWTYDRHTKSRWVCDDGREIRGFGVNEDRIYYLYAEGEVPKMVHNLDNQIWPVEVDP